MNCSDDTTSRSLSVVRHVVQNMFAVKEALSVLLTIMLQHSFELTPNVTAQISKKYVRVAVEASSFMSIRTTNIGTKG